MAAALRLTELMTQTSDIGGYDGNALAGLENIEITGLTADSRAARSGYLFAALPGQKATGVDFIADAAGRGAVAVLGPIGTRLNAAFSNLTLIEDSLPRRRFARMAAAFYGAQPQTMVAVTGTSGKSSTVSFARQLWKHLGHDAASIGTIGIESDHFTRYGTLTTADPVELHADLAKLAHEGVTHAAMEASSHGLDQYRLDGVKLRAAGFTSFGRDHLDYHATSEDYLEAKLRLFTEILGPDGIAVLNADIPEFNRICAAAEQAGHPILSYGERGRQIRIVSRTADSAGQLATIEVFGRRYDIELKLAGGFQLMNALCALGLVIASTFKDLSEPAHSEAQVGRMVGGLTHLQGVRGRLELVARLPNGAAIYVDYAHKPDALVAILEALRHHTAGKLVVVFGCGGDRDAGKRPLMGEIASRLADRVIVTDDNPRSEKPAAIRAAILARAPHALEIGDRADAIVTAIRELDAGDVLVIAGKGHEQGQIIGRNVYPFDDAVVARACAAGVQP
jgi:UDP-N-acetylmuramoyl-L-alanyl-D-glutamate--2,6-diaminopimelate ligase